MAAFQFTSHLQDKVYISNLNGASIRFFAKSTVEPIVMGNLRPLLNRVNYKDDGDE